jgi:hypothetical protein
MGILPRAEIDSMRIRRAKGAVYPEGSEWGLYMGNMASFAFSATATRTNYPSLEDSTGVPAFTDTTSLEATATWEMRNYNELAQRIAYLANKEVYVQASAQNLTLIKTAPLFKGATFKVPAKMATPKTFTITPEGGGAAIQLVLDEHYAFDGQAGEGIIRKLPDGYDPKEDDELVKTFTYDQAAYENDRYDGLSIPNGIRGAVVIRDTNARGPKFGTQFHLMEMTPDGEQQYLSEEDLSSISVTATLYQDPNKLGTGNGFYEAVRLPDLLA